MLPATWTMHGKASGSLLYLGSFAHYSITGLRVVNYTRIKLSNHCFFTTSWEKLISNICQKKLFWISSYSFLCKTFNCLDCILTWSVERLGAVITSKGALFWVCHNVSSQFTWSGKRLGTMRTLVWFLSCVNVCVRLQRYCCCKTLLTVLTMVRTLTYGENFRN